MTYFFAHMEKVTDKGHKKTIGPANSCGAKKIKRMGGDLPACSFLKKLHAMFNPDMKLCNIHNFLYGLK